MILCFMLRAGVTYGVILLLLYSILYSLLFSSFSYSVYIIRSFLPFLYSPALILPTIIPSSSLPKRSILSIPLIHSIRVGVYYSILIFWEFLA